MTTDDSDVQTYAGYVAGWAEGGLYLPLSSCGYLNVPDTKPYPFRDPFAKALLVALERGLVTATLVASPPRKERLWPLKKLGIEAVPLRPVGADDVDARLNDGSAWDAAAREWICIEPTTEGLSFAREVRCPEPFMDELAGGGVVYPWRRRELREGLAVLVDPEHSAEPWLFGDAINDLPDSALGLIGWTLRSEAEERALSALIRAVDVVVHWSRETGVENNDWDWTAPDYPAVAEAAARLLRLIDDADSRPDPPSSDEIVRAFTLVISGKREPYQAGNWAGQWLVWGRGDEPEATWHALEVLSKHHVEADQATPEVIEDFRRGLAVFQQG